MSVIAKHTLIGFRRYNFNGTKGMNLHCIEHYDEDDDSKGSNPINIRAPYDEAGKLMELGISFDKPVVVEMEGKFNNRQNNSVFECKKILNVSPVNGSGPKPAMTK